MLVSGVPDDRVRPQIGERDVLAAGPLGLVADDEVARHALHRLAVQRAVRCALVLEAPHLAAELLLDLLLALGRARADVGLGPAHGEALAPQVLRARLAQVARAALLHRERGRRAAAVVAVPHSRVARRADGERERPGIDGVAAAAAVLGERADGVLVVVHLDVVLARALVRLDHARGGLGPGLRHLEVAAEAERARLGEPRGLLRAGLGADREEVGGVAPGVEAGRVALGRGRGTWPLASRSGRCCTRRPRLRAPCDRYARSALPTARAPHGRRCCGCRRRGCRRCACPARLRLRERRRAAQRRDDRSHRERPRTRASAIARASRGHLAQGQTLAARVRPAGSRPRAWRRAACGSGSTGSRSS